MQMSSKKCPPLIKLHEFLDREMEVQEFQTIHEHVQVCQKCTRVIKDLKTLAEYLKAFKKERAKEGEALEEKEDCLKTDAFVSYYRKALSAKEREKVEEHLCRCLLCRKKMLIIFDSLRDMGGCMRREKEVAHLSGETPAEGNGAAQRMPPGIYCLRCQNHLEAAFKFCPQCGTATGS